MIVEIDVCGHNSKLYRVSDVTKLRFHMGGQDRLYLIRGHYASTFWGIAVSFIVLATFVSQ